MKIIEAWNLWFDNYYGWYQEELHMTEKKGYTEVMAIPIFNIIISIIVSTCFFLMWVPYLFSKKWRKK